MPQTAIPIGHPLAKKIYSVSVFTETQRLPSLRKVITGPAPKQSDAERKLKGQTSEDYPIVRVTDLQKSRGDSVSIDLFNTVQGLPVTGDEKLSGKMMEMTSSSQDIRIDQYRSGVDPGGKMTQQRTVHNLRTLGSAQLSGFMNRLEDNLCLTHFAGARGYDTGKDWHVPLESHPSFSKIVVNEVRPPTRNRRFFGGNATSVTDLDATDYLSLDTIDRLRSELDEIQSPLQPIRLDGDIQADENPLFLLYVTSRQWHFLQNNTAGGPNWRTFLADAHERSKGFSHPLFMGSTGMWNGILVKKMARAVRFPVGSVVREYDANDVSQNVVAAVDTDRAILLGAQGLADVYGSHGKSGYYYHFHEEETDHGNTVEMSAAAMGGKAKIRFDVDGVPTDHGVMTIDSYAPKPT